MHVDREADSIKSLCLRIRSKFAIKSEALINRLLLHSKFLIFYFSAGEVIDDIRLIEKDDKILVELVKPKRALDNLEEDECIPVKTSSLVESNTEEIEL